MLYRCYELIIVLLSCLIFLTFGARDLAKAASLQLGWIDNSQNEDGFNIERKLGTGGTYSLIATAAPNATSYSDSNLASNTTYCYRVSAFNSAGVSAYTNEACATTSSSTTAPSTVSSPLTAILLGQTGEDIAGTVSETPDGIKDVYIRLTGVQSPVRAVRIVGANGIWQTPFNGQTELDSGDQATKRPFHC